MIIICLHLGINKKKKLKNGAVFIHVLSLYMGIRKLFFFGCAMHLVGSQFPGQGLNLGYGSESSES